MRSPLLAGAVCGLALLLGMEAGAAAYCRATSCTCKHDEPILDAYGDPLLNAKGVPQTTCGQPDGECPRDEDGCQIKGAPNAWPGGCVGFSPNLAGTTQLTPDAYDAAFEAAFQAWALVDCGSGKHPSIQAFALRPTTCAVSAYDADGPNVNSIYFTDDGWTDFKAPRELDSVIARTKTSFDAAGTIFDADIAINSARHDFTVSAEPGTVAYDLVSVLTHEAGHFYGLDHSSDPSAVMYWAYDPGSVKRELQPDDIAAICAAYPPGRAAACDPTPRGGLEDTCGPKPSVAGCSSAGRGSDGTPIAISILGVSVLCSKWKRGKRR